MVVSTDVQVILISLNLTEELDSLCIHYNITVSNIFHLSYLIFFYSPFQEIDYSDQP